MSKALIITDNPIIASVIEAKLSTAGWTNEKVSTNTIMTGDSDFVSNYLCIILIIDIDFIKRFGSIIVKMSAIIRNCTIHTPLYLVFEDDYDQCFASWSQHAKRLFKLAMHDHHLHDAINQIIQLETECVPRTSFCSPMDSI